MYCVPRRKEDERAYSAIRMEVLSHKTRKTHIAPSYKKEEKIYE
jgi:hypothetical protein